MPLRSGTITLLDPELLEATKAVPREDGHRPYESSDLKVANALPEPAGDVWMATRSALSASIPLTMATATQDTEMDVEMAPLPAVSLPSTAGLVDLGVGQVRMSTYFSYLRSGKRWGWLLVLVSATICILFNIGAIGFSSKRLRSSTRSAIPPNWHTTSFVVCSEACSA